MSVSPNANAFNGSGRCVAMTRETLKTVDLVSGADIDDMIKLINNDFKEVKSFKVLFSNITNDQHNPTGPFTVMAIFGANSAISRYIPNAHEDTPWATFRVLEFFEGKFSSFVEYPPADAVGDAPNAGIIPDPHPECIPEARQLLGDADTLEQWRANTTLGWMNKDVLLRAVRGLRAAYTGKTDA